jgi:hypothetical protein
MSELLDEVWMDIKSTLVEDKIEKATKSKTFFISPTEILSSVKE